MFPTLFLLLLELYGLFNQSVPKLYDKGAAKLLKSIALIGYSRKIWLSQRQLGLLHGVLSLAGLALQRYAIMTSAKL